MYLMEKFTLLDQARSVSLHEDIDQNLWEVGIPRYSSLERF